LRACQQTGEAISGKNRFMANDRYYYVYINTNKTHSVFYTGITKYNVNKLVYYESFDNAFAAIVREKQIKGGSRKNKIALINKLNPSWKDLSQDL